MEGFSVTNYTLVVINETSDDALPLEVLTPDVLSYSLTRVDPACTNMTFHMRANNSVGASKPGIVHGSFPVSEL